MALSATYTNFSDVPNGWLTKSGNVSGDLYASERTLFDLLITEAYNNHGVTMVYHVVSFDTSTDMLFGEDNNRHIERKFDFMGYFQLPREEKLWSKFGIQGMDQFSIYVSKRHFQTVSKYNSFTTSAASYDSYIPKIGDIILTTYGKQLYQIIDVKQQNSFLLSLQSTWELLVKPYIDKHVDLSGTTSATIGYIADYTSKASDIFDMKTDVVEKETEIEYLPQPTEKPSSNEFWS